MMVPISFFRTLSKTVLVDCSTHIALGGGPPLLSPLAVLRAKRLLYQVEISSAHEIRPPSRYGGDISPRNDGNDLPPFHPVSAGSFTSKTPAISDRR